MASMPASGSKYVLLQHNHSGGFTAYDSASAAAAAAKCMSETGSFFDSFIGRITMKSKNQSVAETASPEIFRIMDTDTNDILEMSVPGSNLSGSQSELQDIASATSSILPRTALNQQKDDIKQKPSEATTSFSPKSLIVPSSCPTTSILNLPPPTAGISIQASSEICEMDFQGPPAPLS
ncbi:uncharacterized protein Dana_GF20182 [Drosophila ananassae]|uniref:Uncharacterized protein n=1 Tax=Drosophila ananassae TaxID=7217 RepID=A0A0P8Y4S1_DROAN|nr:uncharacterized protein Dana_GF20182 [Drosophila ananassae]